MNKSIFASKTAWMNVLLGIVPLIGTNIPGLEFLADEKVIAGIYTIANLIMRFFTKQPVSVTGN